MPVSGTSHRSFYKYVATKVLFWVFSGYRKWSFGLCRTHCCSCQEQLVQDLCHFLDAGSFMEKWLWIHFSSGHLEASHFWKKEIWFASSPLAWSICSSLWHYLQPCPTLLCLLEDGSQGLHSGWILQLLSGIAKPSSSYSSPSNS